MESRARGGDESLLATRLRHVHGHGRIAEVVSAVALDALAVNRWTDLGAADGERLGTLLRPPVSTAATAALDQLSRELEAALSGEPELVERLERLRRRTELGLD
ncbi:MAG TPA: hypothetical protein VIK31_01095 [Propionibacteriaceae bacterium]|jgi:hypothetical protein